MATKTVVVAEVMACGDCVLIIANGEDTSKPDGGEAHGRKMMQYGAGLMALAVACCGDASECSDFSSAPCGVCGDPLAGDRHKVVELGTTVDDLGAQARELIVMSE